MRDARLKASWEQTSFVCYLLAEPHRNVKRRSQPFRPRDFNPYARNARPQPVVTMPITVLKMFLPGGSASQ